MMYSVPLFSLFATTNPGPVIAPMRPTTTATPVPDVRPVVPYTAAPTAPRPNRVALVRMLSI